MRILIALMVVSSLALVAAPVATAADCYGVDGTAEVCVEEEWRIPGCWFETDILGHEVQWCVE